MRHAQNRSPLWRVFGVLLCVVIGAILGVAAPDQSAPAQPRQPQSFEVHPFVIQGSRLDKPDTFAAATLGWRWSGPVRVYDGTGGKAPWKVPEAVAEWSARSGLKATMTSDPTTAQIVVYEVEHFSTPGYDGAALGLCYYPTNANGVATGQARVELASWFASSYPLTAEHTAIHEAGHAIGLAHDTVDKRAVMQPSVQLGKGYTKPLAADIRNLKTLYP